MVERRTIRRERLRHGWGDKGREHTLNYVLEVTRADNVVSINKEQGYYNSGTVDSHTRGVKRTEWCDDCGTAAC